MFRFFVNEKDGDYFNLSDSTLKHIKVARVTDKEFVVVFEGNFYVSKLEGTRARIIKELDENHEFENEVILAASYIDTKRFELLIQKATELGATKLIPMISKNVSKKLPSNIEDKLLRWNQIALNASEQSFRNKTMIVSSPMNFEDVIQIEKPNKYIAHEKHEASSVELFNQDSLFLVGPEGGFTEQEVLKAGQNGFNTISLGKRILRAETASMFILSRIKQ